ncbi:hypothetical protein F5B20DRAFT_16302 [Whalleya microplaca]|nr:hypothetical protein F5B20DRAFT_16302 [Whalleya microplaca]
MMDQPKVPIVQYGVENKNIPGDPTGWKMKDCGNVCHWSDSDRYKEFPKFGDTDFEMQDGLRVAAVRQFLSRFASSESSISQYGDIVRDTPEELIVDTNIEMLDVRLIKLKDVSCKDKTSYRNSTRSKRVEKLSEKRMATSESPISREVQNFMMARRMSKGEAPKMPMHRATIQNPQGSENRKSWYKSMRHDSCRTFWVKTTREQRDTIRTEARQPTAELLPLLQQIQEEDRSLTRDYFWEYQRDIAATEDTGVYEHIDKDILIILDKHSGLLLCKFRGLFNFLFGEYEVSKVEEAIRKWTSLPPLPLPETSRHMVDDFIRDTKHPEMDLEKATTLEEIEARHQCVVHYGTWASMYTKDFHC